jgi:hypothetical protein
LNRQTAPRLASAAPRLAALAATLMLLPASGCQPRQASTAPRAGTTDVRSASDTVRGHLSLRGSEPLASLVVTHTDGSRAVVLRSAQEHLLRQVVGLDIEVRGTPMSGTAAHGAPPGTPVLDVESFIVKAADGEPAHDGIVVVDGDAVWLFAQGEHLWAPALPQALRTLPGARAWVAGPLDRQPSAWGIISRPD